MRTSALLPLAGLLALALAGTTTTACDTETATTALVENAYPEVDAGAAEAVVVYRAWWATTLFASPVAPAASSATERTVPGEDYAYALLAPGWDPASTDAPTRLVAVRSAAKLAVARGDVLRIHVGPTTFRGDCAQGTTLTQEEADLVTGRLFPGPFAGFTYDAATCTLHAADAGAADAGDAAITDAGDAAASDAGDAG